MSGGLFRDAAIRAAHDKLGTPFGQPSGRRRLIVALMLVILTTSFVFLAITRFAKKETVSGEVYSQAGVTRLTPIRGGTIREVLVRSGDRVSQGQALFIMSYDTMLEDGALLSGKINLAADIQSRSMSEQADMKVAQIQQDRAELQQRLSGIEKDLQSSDEQELIQTRRLAIAD